MADNVVNVSPDTPENFVEDTESPHPDLKSTSPAETIPPHPVLGDIDSIAQESTSFLQSLEKRLPSGDTLDNGKSQPTKYVPGPLQASCATLNDIHKHIEGLIMQNEDDGFLDKPKSPQLRQLDEIGTSAVVSHTMAAYLSTLDGKRLRRVATHIVSDTSLWISKLFRFFDSSAYFNEDGREGLVRICRMVLHLRYPKFGTEGYEALYPRPPVIYIGSAVRPELGRYLCSQLGLPLSNLHIVPCNTVFGSQYKMDTAALEKLVQEDISAGRVPLLVVANVGTPLVGQVENLQRIQELCKSHDIWLHVEGHSLSALCLVSVPNLPAKIGDSMTLPLGTWLGVPSLPHVTLYKASEAALVHAAGLSSFNLHVRLNCFPLWVALQSLGHEGVVSRILHCFQLSDYFLEKLEGISGLQIIGKERLRSKDGRVYSVADVVGKSVSTTMLFDILVPVVVFQYVPSSMQQGSSSEENPEDRRLLKNVPYYDNLNSWLGQVLLRDISYITLDILDLDHHGICLRFCPLETAHMNSVTKEDIEDLCSFLQEQTTILNATVRQRDAFQELVKQHQSLQLVNMTNWAGLGGVRYIPAAWLDKLNELTDFGKEDINRTNEELVLKLKNTDSAFSLGEGDDGMLCVRFGMVTEELNVEELVTLVLTTGDEMEESCRMLETMSEMVRQGIEAANKGLQMENEEKVMQEGLLRYVPLVGNLYNWWSPSTKELGIKGRSFNLTSGIVESTENIYKYHMQIQQGSPLKSPKTPPPTSKAVITPGIKLDTSSLHSRSSSRSSQQGLIVGGADISKGIASPELAHMQPPSQQ